MADDGRLSHNPGRRVSGISTYVDTFNFPVADESIGKLDYSTGANWKMAFGQHPAMGYLHHTYFCDEELHRIGYSSSVHGCV